MADPVGSLKQIAEVALKIKEAVEMVRQNKKDCLRIGRRVERARLSLSLCENNAELMKESAASAALEALGEILGEALVLVTACQERSFVCLCWTAGKLSKQLSKVDQDISSIHSDATFAILAILFYLISKQNKDGAHPPPPFLERPMAPAPEPELCPPPPGDPPRPLPPELPKKEKPQPPPPKKEAPRPPPPEPELWLPPPIKDKPQPPPPEPACKPPPPPPVCVELPRPLPPELPKKEKPQPPPPEPACKPPPSPPVCVEPPPKPPKKEAPRPPPPVPERKPPPPPPESEPEPELCPSPPESEYESEPESELPPESEYESEPELWPSPPESEYESEPEPKLCPSPPESEYESESEPEPELCPPPPEPPTKEAPRPPRPPPLKPEPPRPPPPEPVVRARIPSPRADHLPSSLADQAEERNLLPEIDQVALMIKEAVQTVRQNKEECIQIDKRVNRVNALLSSFENTETMKDPEMSAQLEKLLKTFRHAHTLVTACQRRSITIISPAGRLSKQLREVLDQTELTLDEMIAISVRCAGTV